MTFLPRSFTQTNKLLFCLYTYFYQLESSILLLRLRKPSQHVMNITFYFPQVLHTNWGDRLDEDPNKDEDYIEEFCETFYTGMTKLVSDAMEDKETMVSENLVVEVIQHLELCRMRCSIFKGQILFFFFFFFFNFVHFSIYIEIFQCYSYMAGPKKR